MCEANAYVYKDGTEELYDMQADPHEWHNLADDARYAEVLQQHRDWIPASRAPVPGSRHRVLTRSADGIVTWEGDVISPESPVPAA